MKKVIKRFRNFATVVYPESAPGAWKEILSDEKIPYFISPLHDKDINPDGLQKKPHYHVLIMFEGVKTEDQVRAITEKIGGVGLELVQSIRGYARYLCHLDNPEKARYDENDIVQGGGADYRATISLATDRRQALKEMRAFVRQNNIIDFNDLCDYADEYNETWAYLLDTNSSYVMKEYINARFKQFMRLGEKYYEVE